ncbi:hypothetical protein DRQ33_04085 [bacterium]|nr:MAG: hypothetical protein DRQ33_04085 [bacterium]
MKFITRLILLIIATYAGTTLLAPISILGWDIDLGLLTLVLVSGYVSGNATVGWGAFSGFLLDCLNPQWMGAGLVSRATTALFLSAMREKLNIEHPFMDGAVIFIAGLLDRAIYLALTRYRTNFIYALWRYIFPSALYTAIFAVILIILYRFRKFFKPRLA